MVKYVRESEKGKEEVLTENIHISIASKIYNTVNRLRSFLSPSYLGTWSLGHLVTWSQGHSVTRPLGHMVTRSHSHLVTQALSHIITIFNIATDERTNERTTLGLTGLLRRQ